MATVTEADLKAANTLIMQTAAETVNETDFTLAGSPTFEGSTTAIPGTGRSEKFLNLNGSNQYASFDAHTLLEEDEGILSIRIKPDFSQAGANTGYIWDCFNTGTSDGFGIRFDSSIDDFRLVRLADGVVKYNDTTGLTWSADDVLHMVIMWSNTAGLDTGKALTVYIDNVLVTSIPDSWTSAGFDFGTNSAIGRYVNSNSHFFDGGVYDTAFFSHSSLSVSYTDAEIVQSLYANTFGAGSTHLFNYEVVDTAVVPTAPTLFANTSVGATTADFSWVDNSDNELGFKIYDDSGDVLKGTFSAGATTGQVTGLTVDTEYTFYVVAYNTTGNSTESNAVTFTTGNYGLTIAGRKVRIRTNTGVTVTTAMEVNDAQVTQIGTPGTNYTKIEKGGTLEFNGDATVWKDINMGSAQLSRPSSSQPDIESFVDEAGADTGIETYGFAVGEKVHGSFEMQHDYKQGSDFTFHVHWQGIAAPTGTDNVQWRLTYTVMRDGVTLDATTVIDSPDATINTQYMAVRSDFAAIVGTNYLIGDQFLFTLERVASTGDAYSGDALIATAGVHYEIDTVGSRSIVTK